MSCEQNTAWAGVVPSSSLAEAKEDPWEALCPVRRCAANQERVLEAAVEPLHHPAGLQMVCNRLEIEQVAQGGPQGGAELGSAVQCYDCWLHTGVLDTGGKSKQSSLIKIYKKNFNTWVVESTYR